MADYSALAEFKEGLRLLRNEYAHKALPHFCKAAELDQQNPFYRSYMGLALAQGLGQWQEAEEVCSAAVRMKRTQPELYLNLVEVYRLAGKKEEAIETLIDGLRFTKQDNRLAAELRKLGIRRAVLLPFLPRANVLNRKLGRLRHQVLMSLGKEA